MGKGKKQEHDTFVRDYFSKPRKAIELLRLALSRELLEILDIEKLKVIPENHFKRGRERRADLLFRIPLKPYARRRPGRKGAEPVVYLPMEHKSYQEKEIYGQVQDTIDAIRENVGIFAIIVPFIFYQRETSWPYGKSLAEGWDVPEKVRAVLEASASNLPLQVFDLGKEDPETLNCSLTLRGVLYTLKYIRSRDFTKRLPKIAELLREAATADIEKIISYILNYRDESPAELEKLVMRIREKEIRRLLMSTAEQLIQKGKQEGIEKGKREGKREGKLEAARNMVAEGMELKLVKKITGLTDKQLRDDGIIK